MVDASVIILVADGIRPDTLAGAMARGALPALATLAAEGGAHTIVTSFPSVSIVGYVPMLMGRHPASVGVPGLRWYDRARRLSALLGHSRSYVGLALRRIDRDLDAAAPTLFELAPSSLGMLSGVARGLLPSRRIEAGLRVAARASWVHVRGDVRGSLALDRDLGERLAWRIARERPRFVFAAFPSCDKASHASGAESPAVLDGLRNLDAAVASIRHDAERDGRWQHTHLWVVSDHGHAPIHAHEDLAGLIAAMGFRVRAHPWTTPKAADVAVMVSGNAMAHLYLGLEARSRPFWPALSSRWNALVAALLEREAVDLVALPHTPTRVEVRSRRGTAIIETRGRCHAYRCVDGDPLGMGDIEGVTADEALARSIDGPYPDALMQLAALCGSERCGDVVVSASAGWDLRARYEPMDHVSSHGALHRDHMMVPLVLNRPADRRPRRTVDLFPLALRAMGLGRLALE